MFPDVGSMIVPPGFSFPSRSASSISLIPIRSLTDPPGLMYSSFASDGRGVLGNDALEPRERRVADEVENGRVLARHPPEA